MDIILASASPRRLELLKQIGLSVTVIISDVEENKIKGYNPEEWVQQLAKEKALNVANTLKKGLVIGADTIVVKEGKVLGKPVDEKDAFRMLNFLSGQEHQVMTGIALVDVKTQECLTLLEKTTVKFRHLTNREIKAYIKSGEPFDKAGSYGIQGLGALLVDSIVGCYFNVVGLPLNKLAQGLKKYGLEILN